MKLQKCENGHLFDNDKFVVCPYCAGQSEGEIMKTSIELANKPKVEAKAKKAKAEPAAPAAAAPAPVPAPAEKVTGWLVAVSGADKGSSWALTAGRNFVGGAQEAEIALRDPSVQPERQAVVVFDPETGIHTATPCETKQLFYLNDQVCLAPTAMKSGDKLRVGKVTLVLVPLNTAAFEALWGKEAADAQ